MEFIYVLLHELDTWEDLVVILTEEEAINASIKYPKSRVEFFGKISDLGFIPMYKYYKNGKLFSLES